MGEILNGLGIDFKLFIAQLVNFLILLAVLYRFAYKPLFKMMNERSKKIEDSLALAEKIEKDSEKNIQKQEGILEKAKTEAKSLMVEARDMANREKNDLIQKAEEESKKIIEIARKDIEKEKTKMITETKKKMSELVVLAASKIMEKNITDEDRDRLAVEALEGVAEDVKG